MASLLRMLVEERRETYEGNALLPRGMVPLKKGGYRSMEARERLVH